MNYAKYLAILTALALLTPLSAFARDKNEHSINIQNAVQVGTTQLQPGNYKVEGQESGPAVNVKFLQHGKTVATAPATLKTNDAQVSTDDIVLQKTKTETSMLKEIDIAHHKEALIFGQQSGM